MKIEFLATEPVAHYVDCQFRCAEDRIGDLFNQLSCLVHGFLRLGEQVFLHFAHCLGGIDERIFNARCCLALHANTLHHRALGFQRLPHERTGLIGRAIAFAAGSGRRWRIAVA